MTQILNRDLADTAVIRYQPYSYAEGGIVRPWVPRHDPQSPDLTPVAEEEYSSPFAGWTSVDPDDTEPVVLAEVMPQPPARPDRYRGRRRMPVPMWTVALIGGALAMVAGAFGGGLFVAGAVLMTGAVR